MTVEMAGRLVNSAAPRFMALVCAIFLYWVWYQKQETLAQHVEIVERTGMGFAIYYYSSVNAQYRDEVEKTTEEQAHGF